MSRLLGVSGTMERVRPESQGLEDDDEDDDNDDKFSYFCHSAHPPLQCKSSDSLADSQGEDLGETTPFSLSPRHSYMVKDEELKNRIYAKTLAKHALALDEEAQEFQEPFYKDTEGPGSLSEDEDHSWNYHIPVHQRSRVLRTASMALRGSYDSFQYSKHLGMDAFVPWSHASDPYLGNSEHTWETEPHLLHEEAIGDREVPSSETTYDILKEENTMLRRVVSSMKSSLENQACTVRRLERQLAKEEREAHELQSFVQQTKWNLQLMTQRALEAESTVEELKQEISILRGELESSKAKREDLKPGQITDLGAVKHNIDFALENLHKIIAGANLSIRQLALGAESLHFVAEVLESTGKISEAEEEKEL
ncbi:PREDICTED: serologically defined colon cancer antigen 3 homolog [Calidris pugnax]|uniref:serologically defined colon cancer antigen 3 homolog n=1 Tax=Calidris pugnax TaxID=198806 RepID=UPI00071D7681|nr:PREDICTED: serologically defined colon cancer antigen 3 homolog [Calidris pugnax]